MRRARSALVAVLVAVALVACGGDGGGAPDLTPHVELDGSPRVPDVAGVVDEVAPDFSSVTIDDETYDVAEDLQSFSTVDGSTLPLLQRVGEYVHAGTDGDTIVWMASIADVVEQPEGRVVYYVGDVMEVADGTLVFEDGTVLTLGRAVVLPPPPEEGARIAVTIDPELDAVVEVQPAS